MADLEKTIQENYVTPGHPTAFSGRTRLKTFYGKRVPTHMTEHVLENIHSYTLHRDFKKPKRRNPYYVYKIREQLQIDLIDINQLADTNSGTKFILVALDIFTRFMWVEPLQNKTAVATLRGFKKIIGRMGTPPATVFADRGSEIKNRNMKAYLDDKQIKLMHTGSEVKAGIVERANRSLQDLIYRYMTEKETNTYIDQLQNLVLSYNSREHRTLGMSPNDAEKPENAQQVLTALNKHYSKNVGVKQRQKFRVDDLVRVKKIPTRFARGYHEQFTRELFRVARISTRMPITQYHLKSENHGDEIIGGFYPNELQRVGDVHRIAKVLKRRMRRGVREIFVSWVGFDDDHNCWIPATNVTETFDN